MKGKFVLVLLLLLGATMALADVAPQISGIYVESSEDGIVLMNEKVHIRWNHSAFYTNPGQKCRILCEGHVISPPIPVISKDFIWIGGKKFDGTYMPPMKSFRITVDSPEVDAQSANEYILVGAYPKFTLTAPANGQSLVIGSNCTIRWTHSAWYDLYNTDKLELWLFRPGSSYYEKIAEVPVVNDQFVWQVGKMNNGSTAPAGAYQLDPESSDFHGGHEVSIKLIGLISGVAKYRLHVDKIWIDKMPDCPMCYRLDPRQIKFDRGNLSWVYVELLRNGAVLAKLGRLGPRLAAAAPVQLNLEQKTPSGKLVRRQMDKYELRFLSPTGEVVHQQAVQLEFSK